MLIIQNALNEENEVICCIRGNRSMIISTLECQSLIILVDNRYGRVITKCGFKIDDWLRYISCLLRIEHTDDTRATDNLLSSR